MKNETEQLEALNDIRRMMKESSRFLSLSGLSGVLAGIYALGGAVLGGMFIRHFNSTYAIGTDIYRDAYSDLVIHLVLLCLAILALSLCSAFILSGRKARKRGHKLFDHSSKSLIWSMALPLFSGGIFCLALLQQGGDYLLLICPAMLLFYGLALVASSRLTLDDVRYLGYLEVALGLIACFYKGYSLMFWSLGFGVLHVIYGTIMWFKYDRKV
jgi:hypothetical protein